MHMKNSLYFFMALWLYTIVSCSPKTTPIITDGTYISAVMENIILDENGREYTIDLQEDDKVYYLIRHAEKDTIPHDNPKLTKQGLTRANLLADMMKGTRVDAVYSTMYTRTLFTVDTLASRKGMKIRPYDHKKLKTVFEDIASDTTTSSVIIVGHSNTTPAFANVILGRQEFQSGFDESDYDNFLVVLDKKEEENVVYKLRYRVRNEE